MDNRCNCASGSLLVGYKGMYIAPMCYNDWWCVCVFTLDKSNKTIHRVSKWNPASFNSSICNPRQQLRLFWHRIVYIYITVIYVSTLFRKRSDFRYIHQVVISISKFHVQIEPPHCECCGIYSVFSVLYKDPYPYPMRASPSPFSAHPLMHFKIIYVDSIYRSAVKQRTYSTLTYRINHWQISNCLHMLVLRIPHFRCEIRYLTIRKVQSVVS